MKKLTIEHNHGVCVLVDVTFEAYEYDARAHGGHAFTGHVAQGTVESGGVTSRLLWATSHREYPVGQPMDYDIYGRKPRCVNEQADEWRVSCVSCG
jgi:hypothetical protein